MIPTHEQHYFTPTQRDMAMTSFTLPAAVLVALLRKAGGDVTVTRDELEKAQQAVRGLSLLGAPSVGYCVSLEEPSVPTGSVYVNLTEQGTTSARQRTIEASNATVVLDYDADGQLIGVEVLDATSVSWNGRPMHQHEEPV